jgi:hypothetical protein
MLLERCPWYVAGPLLGLLLIAFRAALNKPFGALGGLTEVKHRADARGVVRTPPEGTQAAGL